MFPNTFTGVSPDWLVVTASLILGARASSFGERRAVYTTLAHAASLAIIKSSGANPRILHDPVDALMKMNASWREVALFGVTGSEYERAMTHLGPHGWMTPS